MSTTTLTVRPAAGSLGAVVTGIDLRAPLAAADADSIHDLLIEHLVLVFRGQELDDQQQLAFALAFGDYYCHPIARVAGRVAPSVGHIVDDVDHPPFQDQYHTDVSWDNNPPTFGVLRMIAPPDRGGDTIFINMYAAYDALSAPMQRAIDGLTAWHDMGEGKGFRSKSGNGITDAAAALQPGAEHPIVATHPITGRKYLYVNRGFTRRICGMHPGESDAILRCLFDHSENPNCQLRWHWNVGDVLLWDERCTQHYAVADFYPRRREVGRVNVVSTTR